MYVTNLNSAMPRTIRMLDFWFLKTPPTPHPPFPRWPSPDGLITVLQPKYTNARISVQRWTSGQYEHVALQNWTVRCSIRIVGDGVPFQNPARPDPTVPPPPPKLELVPSVHLYTVFCSNDLQIFKRVCIQCQLELIQLS